MTDVYVLRVFLGPDGRGGNPLGVVYEVAAVPGERRQAVAANLGFAETVFLDDHAEGALEIYTPTAQLPFAGHPLVGTSWLLRSKGVAVDALRPPAGTVPTWQADGLSWIRGRAAWAAEMEIRQYDSPAAVEALSGAPDDDTAVLYAWAWRDEAAGQVRSRMFAPGLGVPEDEATGAAAVRITSQLHRPLDILQGVGSQLLTKPAADGFVDVGGRVVLDQVRPL